MTFVVSEREKVHLLALAKFFFHLINQFIVTTTSVGTKERASEYSIPTKLGCVQSIKMMDLVLP